VTLTRGIHLGTGDSVVEELHARLDEVADRNGESVPEAGAAQASLELAKAGFGAPDRAASGTGTEKSNG
jgi:hypothetical protein